MGLSPYPTPTDGGLLIGIMVNAAIPLSIIKEILLSILHVVGIHLASWEEYSNISPSDFFECHRIPSQTYMEEFNSRTPAVRFDSLCSSHQCEQECVVCLTGFEPDAEINHLTCGHVFHRMCLEKWLKNWKVTCPLCRTRMVPHKNVDTTPM